MKNTSYVFLFSFCFVLLMSCQENKPKSKKDLAVVKSEVKAPEPVMEYGYNLNDYELVLDTVQPGESFGKIMDRNGVSTTEVYKITNKVKDTFDTRRLVAGKPYAILKRKNCPTDIRAFIYQNDKINYTVVDLSQGISARRDKKPVTVKRRVVSGSINSSLSAAVSKAGLGVALTDELASLYQWKIDFFRIQKGDQFKIIFNEKYINDSIYAGIESIEAAEFIHYDEPYYAFRFGHDDKTGWAKFYDDEAESLQNFFLKAPVDFTRISSRYTRRRYHPVQKRWKAHKGTDYAAPRGTPIRSTADGVVINSRYAKYNGNYVKIRHNRKYTTQYLHMSKRHVRVGQHVKQGDIIGYVGQTGLATGPHVCYRFWVNGRQVDPYRQKLPSSEPLKDSLKPEYFKAIAPLKAELDALKVEKPQDEQSQLAGALPLKSEHTGS